MGAYKAPKPDGFGRQRLGSGGLAGRDFLEFFSEEARLRRPVSGKLGDGCWILDGRSEKF